MSHEIDPVLKHSRREGLIIALSWVASTVYCCGYSYLFGYTSKARPLGVEDIHPIFGMPSWFFWGVMVPWGVCALFTFWFAGFYMADDDLGTDHAAELNADIREGGLHE